MATLSELTSRIFNELDPNCEHDCQDMLDALCDGDVCKILSDRGYTQEDIETAYIELKDCYGFSYDEYRRLYLLKDGGDDSCLKDFGDGRYQLYDDNTWDYEAVDCITDADDETYRLVGFKRM